MGERGTGGVRRDGKVEKEDEDAYRGNVPPLHAQACDAPRFAYARCLAAAETLEADARWRPIAVTPWVRPPLKHAQLVALPRVRVALVAALAVIIALGDAAIAVSSRYAFSAMEGDITAASAGSVALQVQ